MKAPVMYRNISPLLLLDDAVLLCITTISDQPANFFDEIVNKPGPIYNEGDPVPRLFRRYNFSPICAACRAQGITVECEHGRRRLPKWQSARKLKLVKSLMSSNEGDVERELLGAKATRGPECFAKDRVLELFAQPTVLTSRTPYVRKIFVTIDPNSGTHDSSAKPSSDFAMVSAYESATEGLVFCGIESIDANDYTDYVDKVINHLKTLRLRPEMRDATFVFSIENNLGSEAGRLKGDILGAGIGNCVFMQDADLKAGVRTSSLVKLDHHVAFHQ